MDRRANCKLTGNRMDDRFSGNRKTARGEISVFLALVFVLVASLVLSSVEMIRTQTTETYLKIAADSAIDSLFSQYHLDLWNKYRLLGVEMYAPEEITDEYYGFLEPYFSEDSWNWYGLEPEKKDIALDEYALMTDSNGAVFEKEVLEYMTFGIALDAAGLEERSGLQSMLESALSTSETAGEMENCSKKARELEKKLNVLAKTVSEHNQLIPKMRKALQQGNGKDVRKYLKKLRKALDEIENDSGTVETRTENLKEKVAVTKDGLEGKLAEGKITQENYGQLEKQLEGFDSYTEETGEKNRELQELLRGVSRNREELDLLETEADAAQEYIDNWEPEQILVRYDPPKEEGGEPIPVYEDEVLDEAEVWRSAAECFSSYEELTYVVGSGEIDEEKSNQFDRISDLLSGSLIELVVPGGSAISKEKRDLDHAPSKQYLTSETNIFSSDDYLLYKAATDEYAMLELTHVLSKENDISPAEVEYVLWGNETDLQNVSAVAGELIAIRTGLNLAYIFTDAQKLKDAGELAVKISGGGAGTPVVLVVTFLILTVWAAAQAVLDARRIFSGDKVPFIHTKGSFTLTMEGLLKDFEGILNKKNTSQIGLDYEDYLRMFLFSRSGSLTDYRIMDVIQSNLRKEQEDFRMDRLYTFMDMAVSGDSKHIFSDLMGGRLGKYRLTVKACYGYS